jgi:MOSC domain-containing protein YiiM
LTLILPGGFVRVEAIYIKRAHRGVMDEVREARLVAGQGLAGSVGRSSRRQVSVLSLENWTRFMDALGGAEPPSRRRANVVVSGVDLEETRGRVLRIGEGQLLIGGELTPCERMDEVIPGLRELMVPHWGGGVFGQVPFDAIIRVGDAVELLDRSEA